MAEPKSPPISHRPRTPNRDARPVSTVGIIGAGQLGLMLCDAARELELQTLVVSDDPSAPGLGAATWSYVADYEDPALAEKLVAGSDAITFEFEAVPSALLDRIEAAEQSGRVVIRPSLPVLRTIQSKIRQKRWMAANDIPTLPFTVLPADPGAALAKLRDMSFPLVQKAARGGYDGYGVQVLHSPEDLDALWPVESLVEPYLPDRPEIAVVLARGSDGEMRCFEPVSMMFDDRRNILDCMQAPAGLAPEQRNAALENARRVVAAFRGVGVFSVEMFITPQDELVVNEIAPRVHNAGHHTIEACAASQFEQHLRAVAGLPLASTEGEHPSVMQNLLFDDSMSPLLGQAPGVLAHDIANTFVHWYGKTEGRPGRKVGHVTMLGDDPMIARDRAREALAALAAGGRGGAA